MNYYNEFDPKAAAWLRELIVQGEIPNGDVDTRSITDVKPHELKSYTQCHFFAGIGGWSLALKLAAWPTERPIWTGSCPCQPFSSAGKQLGDKDSRHLWPVFFNLIREYRPEFVFGEQVASAIGKGWLDGVSADLEGTGYACGAAVLGAHSVGAPHIRQRLYWVANAVTERYPARDEIAGDEGGRTGQRAEALRRGDTERLVYPDGPGSYSGRQASTPNGHGDTVEPDGSTGGMEYPMREGREGQSLGLMGTSQGNWSRYDTLHCTDGKSRRVESGTFPLAHGVPARVVRLRGYGNAIVPQVAAEFVTAFMEVQP